MAPPTGPALKPTTSLEELPGNRICRRWLIHRELDSSGYQVAVTGAGLELKGP